jgi:integrase/recombinase XerC
MNLSTSITEYLEFRYDLAAKTQRIYRDHLTRLQTELADPELATITPQMLARYMGKLRRADGTEYAPGYKHQLYRTLHSFFNHAVKSEWLTRNPLASVPKPPNPTGPKPRMTIDQIKRLIEAIESTRGRRCVPRNRAIILTMIDTGLRRNECASLELTQLDFDAATARVYDRKTGQYRYIPISSYCIEAIKQYLPHRHPAKPTNRLFLTATGGPMNPDNINSIIDAIRKRLDFPLHPHLLRHTFANLYLRKGDLLYLQKILGHSDIRTTAAFYTAPEFDEIQAQYNQASPLTQINSPSK